mgnify:CR=1 FL=1
MDIICKGLGEGKTYDLVTECVKNGGGLILCYNTDHLKSMITKRYKDYTNFKITLSNVIRISFELRPETIIYIDILHYNSIKKENGLSLYREIYLDNLDYFLGRTFNISPDRFKCATTNKV